ncbi:IclR family transcriptional regulator [Amycolatopsis magusensis]|uniref:IclR family acetate operon transcriptional repressor n=1 Tax=Amycolatopsis magusensis TaxID=882444 RepID=A0ABS4Q0S7_9PSEU|nr:IclR family transcriptional regulator [Amycolatopsis magusensis]MBP2185268.1 IclR family acetate operon transcriptional repressor [Amycolatopsis magusensis]MDI5980626.1 IclR family transcriptional regulator [Amycolatopsis magusensis]
MAAEEKQPGPRPASPAVGRTLTVLETLVHAEDGLTLTALARETGIPLATCAAIVYTLEQRGYAARRVVGRSHFWRVTLRLYDLAAPLIKQDDLAEVAQPELRDLADELGMPAHVGVLDGASVVYVAKAATPGFIQFDTYPGKVAPFNLTALGRAIAAYLPAEQLDPLLPQLVAGRGPKAKKPSARVFLAQLDKVRDAGFAVEDEEEEPDIACVAAPVFHSDGRIAGSLGVTGFARDLIGDKLGVATELVVRQAKEVSAKLGF